MQGVAGDYKGLQGVTRGYKGLVGIKGVTGGPRRLERVTKVTRG